MESYSLSNTIIQFLCLKENSNREISQAQIKEREKCKILAVTDLNVLNGSRDIPSQSQEFEQDVRRHFVAFQPLFHVNITSHAESESP